jgi:hypothetical protein
MSDEIITNDSEFDSPAWHEKALAETERRYEADKEKAIDWAEAKELLRQQYDP